MGTSDTDQMKLHFEIRRFGKPVDPSNISRTQRVMMTAREEREEESH